MRLLLFGFSLFLFACGTKEPARQHPNRWADARLMAVLDAQDHRDVDALCALLNDTSAKVRAAAALAFASVHDSAGMPCLLDILGDPDPLVRAHAVFALGFVADSLVVYRMGQQAQYETDSAVRQAMCHAVFMALARNHATDVTFLMAHLANGDSVIRTRAAALLGRCPKGSLLSHEADIVHAVSKEKYSEVRASLALALKNAVDTSSFTILQHLSAGDPVIGVRVNAIRALPWERDPTFLLSRLGDSAIAVRQTVVDKLRTVPMLDGSMVWRAAKAQDDPSIMVQLCGLVMKHDNASIGDSCRAWLNAMDPRVSGPYLNADLLRARFNRYDDLDTLRALMRSSDAPILRQAAFEQWLICFRDHLRLVEMDRRAQDRVYAEFYREALTTGDAGLVAAVCERIELEDAAFLVRLFTNSTMAQVRSSLHPVRDLEALRLLDQLAAKRDGLPPPAHQSIPFNHPIDAAQLRALPQGQRYRITTGKGEIILTTDVDECPGSSLAFDSLVTAGYYNGKAFHRVVPGFVAQGGCPRGDGYGGMPWTLRTEIGHKPFTTGSVGLASAGRDTESCQFFITHSATPHLDGRYTRFGEVVEGMDVVWQLQVGDVMERVERIPEN